MRLKASYKEFVALKNHTGLGWDPITQTVTAPDDVWENYVQAHPNAKQFQTKGLEHYELMSEIFAKSFATGAFARSSRQGAPTSDDEREMDERFHAYTSEKGVPDESCTSGSKRKSSGQGQSSKNPKIDDALQSWQRSCEARERYYLQAEANELLIVLRCNMYEHPKINGAGSEHVFEGHEHVHITRMANHVYDHGTRNEVPLDPQFVRSLVIPLCGLRGEGASEVHGEVRVQNVHGNEDGVPAMQQHNHVNMSREQLLQMGQWRDEVAASMWEAYNNRYMITNLKMGLLTQKPYADEIAFGACFAKQIGVVL
ncbi:Uncharacterized protein LOK49_LG09G01823 [Camellia lanceoleosa]|uniref:Uncharacterized protein n=1 Tax=Camellia lanceoleosa TaxID=1840588 RepID=A0ACC0GHL2_9ERIC|nr:Uncharacterized protein LOK49_LG09G01823 [Camellia lanceoleosa]